MHHTGDLSAWQKDHAFDDGNPVAERGVRWVVVLTAVMMVAELIGGWLFGSMALLADGWHMGTHVAALGLTAFAYWYARHHATDPRFAFGTWKVNALGGFASAIVLGVVALYMAGESLFRLVEPVAISYDQAIAVAVVGLAVNLLSAWLLQGHHQHSGDEHHDHHHDHGDLNLRAAYLHVLADALTSVLAIVALVAGRFAGWAALDPLMGVVGAVVVGRWALGLARDSSKVLLDREVSPEMVREIHECLTGDGNTVITDLHVWRVGRHKFAVVVTLVALSPQAPHHYRDLLRVHEELAHVTIEVHQGMAGRPESRSLAQVNSDGASS